MASKAPSLQSDVLSFKIIYLSLGNFFSYTYNVKTIPYVLDMQNGTLCVVNPSHLEKIHDLQHISN